MKTGSMGSADPRDGPKMGPMGAGWDGLSLDMNINYQSIFDYPSIKMA
jgi:hypothetical protein